LEEIMECPNIDKSPKDEFNRSVNYKDLGGSVDYVFYDHVDAYGKVTMVQFCRKIGRKRNVFQCLNEDEWRQCPEFVEGRRR
jgi:hypothetical protein